MKHNVIMIPSKYTGLLNEVVRRVSMYIWVSNVNNIGNTRLYVYTVWTSP